MLSFYRTRNEWINHSKSHGIKTVDNIYSCYLQTPRELLDQNMIFIFIINRNILH